VPLPFSIIKYPREHLDLVYLLPPINMSRVNLLVVSGLRGFQILFAVVVLGLSVTLIKGHTTIEDSRVKTGPPPMLSLSVAIGAVTLVAAIASLAIAWTNCLREYIELVIDVTIVVVNMVGGTVCCR
jgi:hypothetical protein